MYIYYRQFSSIFRFITVVGLYLIGGFIYQRLVVGAKGWEQLPNYSFWQDFGNLQAVSLKSCTIDVLWFISVQAVWLDFL